MDPADRETSGAVDAADIHLLRFYPVVCTVDFGFWRQVNTFKLIKWRLETPVVQTTASLVPLPPSGDPDGHVPQERRGDIGGSLGWRLHLDRDAFQSDCSVAELDSAVTQDSLGSGSPSLSLAQSFAVHGIFFNANSAEDFRKIDRHCFIQQVMSPILKSLLDSRKSLVELHSGSTPSEPPVLLQCHSPSNNLITHLTTFLILSFADLKSHLCYYNVALPALRPLRDITSQTESHSPTLPFGLDCHHLTAVGEALLGTASACSSGLSGCCVLIRRTLSSVSSLHVSEKRTFFDGSHKNWLLSILEGCNDGPPSDGNSSDRRQIDSDTILVPLWVVLCQFHLRQTRDEIPRLITAEAEAFICVVDAVKTDRDTLGWPLRSVLFALGFLGFSGVKLRLLLFRDGPSGVHTSQHPVASIGLTVELPSAECFVLQRSQDDSLKGDSSPSALSDGSSELFICGNETEPSGQSFLRDSLVPGWLRLLVSKSDQSQQHSVTFSVDLSRHLNSTVSQADAVNLNVRLIQWRILPTLDTSKLQNLRFLILGVGTLGCNILRNLVAWGVTQFTLIDSGRVALSSPVRQTLFTHEDATCNNGRGRLKVVAAKKRLLEIRPDLLINAIQMDIPMPGHPRFLSSFQSSESTIPFSTFTKGELPTTLNSLHRTLELLERLIDVHDIVLLLTDSRESRWLPSMLVSTRPLRRNSNFLFPPTLSPNDPPTGVLSPLSISQRVKSPPPFPTLDELGELIKTEAASSHSQGQFTYNEVWNRFFTIPPTFISPVCITVALGFDSFVVMRHGQRHVMQSVSGHFDDESGKHNPARPLLACYFCNDLTAPADSYARRPLDQQCTVTRPGVSGLASSVAAELIAAISQHPQSPDPPHSATDFGPTDRHHSCLGATPHTIRGNLGDFHLICTETGAFSHCISCSTPIAQKYCSTERVTFIEEALGRSEILEEISGLAAMKGCHREDEVLTFDED